MVFSDYLTRWVEAFPVPSVEETVIARLLIDEIISRHGAPRVLLSDRGTNFLSKVVAEVCKIFQIQKVNTSSYHPQTDGLILPCVSLCQCTFPKTRKIGTSSYCLFCLRIGLLF